jgi:hypothetical protein
MRQVKGEFCMQPIKSSGADSFVYYGEREGWLIALSQHRDSDALGRSNWAVITADVLSVSDEDAAIESASHFLVGWVEYLLVRPGSSAARRAQEWRDRLDNYPIANEEHYSMLEWNEEWCLRCDRGTREAHDGKGLSGDCGKFRGEYERDEILSRWAARD